MALDLKSLTPANLGVEAEKCRTKLSSISERLKALRRQCASQEKDLKSFAARLGIETAALTGSIYLSVPTFG